MTPGQGGVCRACATSEYLHAYNCDVMLLCDDGHGTTLRTRGEAVPHGLGLLQQGEIARARPDRLGGGQTTTIPCVLVPRIRAAGWSDDGSQTLVETVTSASHPQRGPRAHPCAVSLSPLARTQPSSGGRPRYLASTSWRGEVGPGAILESCGSTRNAYRTESTTGCRGIRSGACRHPSRPSGYGVRSLTDRRLLEFGEAMAKPETSPFLLRAPMYALAASRCCRRRRCDVLQSESGNRPEQDAAGRHTWSHVCLLFSCHRLVSAPSA